jgi:hypothetical protein
MGMIPTEQYHGLQQPVGFQSKLGGGQVLPPSFPFLDQITDVFSEHCLNKLLTYKLASY